MADLGQNPHHIVEVGHRAHPSIPPHTEGHARNHPRHILHGKSVGHCRSHQIDGRGRSRMDPGIYRICKGRKEDPGPAWTGLMVIIDDLGIPLIIEHLRYSPGFRHIVHEPVPVIIMPDIIVVEPWRPGCLKRGADRAVIPESNNIKPVRIHDRHQQKDDILANMLHFAGIFRCHPPRKQRGHLGTCDFRCMQTGINPDDRPSLLRKCLRLGLRNSPPGERCADILPPVQGCQILLT